MLLRNPREFDRVAREWAVLHAGAPRKEAAEGSGGATAASLRAQRHKTREDMEKDSLAQLGFPVFFIFRIIADQKKRYEGYNKNLVDRFCGMGFEVPRVVSAFKYVGIDKMGGEDYEMDEGYMGDVTAHLLGEP